MKALTATAVLAVATAIAFVAQSPAAVVMAQPQDKPDHQLRGTVTDLWVNAPGSVTFRVHGTDANGKVQTLWFKSPSDKDVNTLAENLALSLIRHAIQDEHELLVDAKDSSGDDGSSAAKAFSFIRVGIRPRPAGSAPR